MFIILTWVIGKGKGLIDFRRGCGRSSLGARLDTGMRMRYVALINGNETYDVRARRPPSAVQPSTS